jgi:tetratricopeptide (TPR) repeat protein
VRHAEILLATGRIEDALAAAQDVVIWQPAYAPARIALFEAYDRLGRVEEALNEARAAFAVAPDHPHVRLRLAEIEKKANQSMMT